MSCSTSNFITEKGLDINLTMCIQNTTGFNFNPTELSVNKINTSFNMLNNSDKTGITFNYNSDKYTIILMFSGTTNVTGTLTSSNDDNATFNVAIPIIPKINKDPIGNFIIWILVVIVLIIVIMLLWKKYKTNKF